MMTFDDRETQLLARIKELENESESRKLAMIKLANDAIRTIEIAREMKRQRDDFEFHANTCLLELERMREYFHTFESQPLWRKLYQTLKEHQWFRSVIMKAQNDRES